MSEETVLPSKSSKDSDIEDASQNTGPSVKGTHEYGYVSKGTTGPHRDAGEPKGHGDHQERCPNCGLVMTELRIRSGDCCRWVVMR